MTRRRAGALARGCIVQSARNGSRRRNRDRACAANRDAPARHSALPPARCAGRRRARAARDRDRGRQGRTARTGRAPARRGARRGACADRRPRDDPRRSGARRCRARGGAHAAAKRRVGVFRAGSAARGAVRRTRGCVPARARPRRAAGRRPRESRAVGVAGARRRRNRGSGDLHRRRRLAGGNAVAAGGRRLRDRPRRSDLAHRDPRARDERSRGRGPGNREPPGP